MVVHDEQIGQMLDKLDELGIGDNNDRHVIHRQRPENDTWPDGGQHTIPRPERIQLGGRLARAMLHTLAGQIERVRCKRHCLAKSTCSRHWLAAAGNPDVLATPRRKPRLGVRHTRFILTGTTRFLT